VPRPQILGNDDVERFTPRLRPAEPKDPLGTGVPEPDHPFVVGIDHRIGRLVSQDAAEPLEIEA
jgi:hypothetical protein